MVEWPCRPSWSIWVVQLATPLATRQAWRLLPLSATPLRTPLWPSPPASAAGSGRIAAAITTSSVPRTQDASDLLLLPASPTLAAPSPASSPGLDDTPTARYGPHVEGAGIHHNPSPGPADQSSSTGHLGVTIAWLAYHPALKRAIGLTLRALLYVRARDISRLTTLRGHRTKLEMAGELVTWAADWLKYLGKTLWIVADGAYAKRPFLKAAKAAGVVVVSRLRKDAALWGVPVPLRAGAHWAGGTTGSGLTASRELVWPSGQASTAAGSRRNSSCTGRQ